MCIFTCVVILRQHASEKLRGCYWKLSCLSASGFSFSHWIWFDTHSPTFNPKGNQHCTFIRRTNVDTEAPILWPPDAKSQLVGKDFDAGKD